ncbi:unnamed protein product [Ixodes pacificus]
MPLPSDLIAPIKRHVFIHSLIHIFSFGAVLPRGDNCKLHKLFCTLIICCNATSVFLFLSIFFFYRNEKSRFSNVTTAVHFFFLFFISMVNGCKYF